jgi:hypothetical protein
MAMKALVAIGCGLTLAGCAMLHKSAPAPSAAPVVPVAQQGLRSADGAAIEAVPFRPGISSATVERLGRQHGCASREGAGLVTPAGPVEVYKMVCESGKVFMARCELRQCRAM